MKEALIAICTILILSSPGFSSDIRGIISVIDPDSGTFEVCGVEIMIMPDFTTIVDRQQNFTAPEELEEGDYVEIEGRFIEPAKLEASRITLGREVITEVTTEAPEETGDEEPAALEVAAEEDQPQDEPAKKEAEPAPTTLPAAGTDKLRGSLQNADVKTGILILNGVIVQLDTNAKITGPDKKDLPLKKLRRRNRVECQGTRLSKKKFLARTVRVVR